jgi:hypothetical protein
MNSKLLSIFLCLGLMACASNPNKPKDIETKIDNQEDVGGGAVAGTNDKGEMITQKKIQLGTYLRDLQREVYSLETQIYGDDSTGNKGLYGALRDCRDQARKKENGGDGKVTPPPKKNILTKGEDMALTPILEKIKPGKVGSDENKKLVAVSEDYLLDRIKRFEKYKEDYQDRKEQFDEDTRKCQADLSDKKAQKKSEAANSAAASAKSDEAVDEKAGDNQ